MTGGHHLVYIYIILYIHTVYKYTYMIIYVFTYTQASTSQGIPGIQMCHFAGSFPPSSEDPGQQGVLDAVRLRLGSLVSWRQLRHSKYPWLIGYPLVI
jgi:hypothetical protein